MTIQMDIGDRACRVTVHSRAGRLEVVADGHVYRVDAARVGDMVLSLLVGDAGGGAPVRSVDASIAAVGDEVFDVRLEGRIVRARLHAAGGRRRDRRVDGTGAGGGPQRVTAPMPGRIVRVLVRPGDPVTARQGLVVVEAMKMENELRAARDGRVREVAVAEGQSVEAGAVLVTVD